MLKSFLIKFTSLFALIIALNNFLISECNSSDKYTDSISSSVQQSGSNKENSVKSDEANHGDRFADIYLILFLIITGAVLGRKFIAKKLNQPEVLGELIIGVVIGIILFQLGHPIMTLIRYQDDVNNIIQKNLTGNQSWPETVRENIPEEAFKSGGYGKELETILTDPGFIHYNNLVKVIFFFSGLGVLILLFLVGLESSIEEMFEVGKSALIVAILGVIFPMFFGYVTSMLIIPGHDPNLYLFIGATLCATSIGITARVFKDLRKVNTPEAKIVLGAAVIDDVLGLIVLAVVAGIIESGVIEIGSVIIIILKAVLFLGVTFFIGKYYLKRQIMLAAFVDRKNVSLLFPFAMMVLLAWISDKVGLASIVGAFAAGLIIKEEFFGDDTRSVKSVIEPIEAIFAPVFFVIMGMQVDITAFMKTEILLIAIVLTIVAIIGKLLSSIFTKGMDKKIIGIGMIPRGEVGLIFASIGKSIGILDSSLFSALIIVIILTTFVTPPGLKWAFAHYDKKRN